MHIRKEEIGRDVWREGRGKDVWKERIDWDVWSEGRGEVWERRGCMEGRDRSGCKE